MPTPMATILLIDDDAQMRMLCQTALEAAGYCILSAENGPHGLRLLQEQEMDLALVDIFMPNMDGLEVIPLLHKTQPACKIIAMFRGVMGVGLSGHGEAVGGERHAQETV